MRRRKRDDLGARIAALEQRPVGSAEPWSERLPKDLAPMVVTLARPDLLDPPPSPDERRFAALAIHIALRQSEGDDTSAAEAHLERTRTGTRWAKQPDD